MKRNKSDIINEIVDYFYVAGIDTKGLNSCRRNMKRLPLKTLELMLLSLRSFYI